MQHAGIILAAGASIRMGTPKALLRTPTGIPLAQQQNRLLTEAGYYPVVIVLGADAERIESELSACEVIHNTAWENGRLSSVQTGLNAVDADGIFILPVDTAGISVHTLKQVIHYAEQHTHPAIRPTHKNQPGKIAWVSRTTAQHILDLPQQQRLDDFLQITAVEFPVNDPAILNNVNTPGEWKRISCML